MSSNRGSEELADDRGNAADLQAIDLLLEQGTADELAALRGRIASDPTMALDMADTVTLLERLRTVRTDPSPGYAGKLYSVVLRAERRQPSPPRRLPWLLAAAAAAIAFGAATWLHGACQDTGSTRVEFAALPAAAASGSVGDAESLAAAEQQTAAEAEPGAEAMAGAANGNAVPTNVVPTTAELARLEAIDAMRRRFEIESATELTAALDSAVHAMRDPLDSWLSPRNSLAIRRLDHELRTHREIRLRALRSEGAMLAADERVQTLANAIAEELSLGGVADDRRSVREVAFAVRALIAAGVSPGVRQRAFTAASDWLCERLPSSFGDERILALAALVESSAVQGRPMPEIVAAGRSVIDAVMVADEDSWQRRRPYLLSGQVGNGILGDAGHALAMLPALGLDAGRCEFVRRLLLGELKQRCDVELDGPDRLAAMLYGFGDLLSDRERDGLVLQLRRWKPARLAPDYVTVHQIAWGIEPGRSGFTRLQRELRQLVILPDPEGLVARAGLCLSLASNFAAWRAESLERFVTGE
ncbi:MAG: hypothetical protein KDC98_14535 [Planctomycetes bacterium]|nr:hypothetical protein [Planctomycetota bacterium]